MNNKLRELQIRLARLEKQADLNPPLGTKEPCYVVERARRADIPQRQKIKEILRGLKRVNHDGVSMLKDIPRSEGSFFYRLTYPKLLVERASDQPLSKKGRKPLITAFELNNHTQWRMDIRGITVRDIELVLRDYQKPGDSKKKLEYAAENEKKWKEYQGLVDTNELDLLYADKKICHEKKIKGRTLVVCFIPKAPKPLPPPPPVEIIDGEEEVEVTEEVEIPEPVFEDITVSIKTAWWKGENDPYLDC